MRRQGWYDQRDHLLQVVGAYVGVVNEVQKKGGCSLSTHAFSTHAPFTGRKLCEVDVRTTHQPLP